MFLLVASVGFTESWVRGIPACEEQAGQASPLQNQIPLLAPWVLPRGEMCEAQGHLALHGNKVSLLSDALMFVFLLPFCGLWGSSLVYYCCYGSQNSSVLKTCLQKHLHGGFLSRVKLCICGLATVQNSVEAHLSCVCDILKRRACISNVAFLIFGCLRVY